MWPAICLAILLVLGVTIVLYRHKRAGFVKPYREIRTDLINELADEDVPRKPMPARPEELDARLPALVGTEMARLFPPSREDWSKFMKLWYELRDSIENEFAAIDYTHTYWFELVHPARRMIWLVDIFESEVNNGGFDQFYLNTSGAGAAWLPEALRLLNQEELAQMVEKCNSVFPNGPARERGIRLAAMDKLTEEDREIWSSSSEAFYKLNFPNGGLAIGSGVPYVLTHPEVFFKTSKQ